MFSWSDESSGLMSMSLHNSIYPRGPFAYSEQQPQTGIKASLNTRFWLLLPFADSSTQTIGGLFLLSTAACLGTAELWFSEWPGA